MDDKITDKSEVSDGYHTFNELYMHRHALFSALCNRCDEAWKSKQHDDGTMYEGSFIAGIGENITYHIPLNLWEDFRCKELEKAPVWNGHTGDDVIFNLFRL